MSEKIDRVFFIGAGFSRALGYPLGEHLLPELVRYLQRLSRTGPRRPSADKGDVQCADGERVDDRAVACLVALSQFLQSQFGISCDLLNAPQAVVERVFRRVGLTNFFNLIQVLSDSELRIPGRIQTYALPIRVAERSSFRSSHRRMMTDPRLLYDCLKAALRSYFVELSAEHSSFGDLPLDLRSFLRALNRSKDVVVSFNWDSEIEYFLWELSRRESRPSVSYTWGDWERNDSQAYLILKPHGSVTWYPITSGIWSSVDPVAGADRRIQPEQRRLVSYYVEDELPEDREGHVVAALDSPPAITPPTFAKRFDTPEQRIIWADVVRVCSSAREIVFLGYRVPEDDFLTAAAVRSALIGRRSEPEPLKCLVVLRGADPQEVEPYESYRRSFQSIFGDLPLEPRHFMDWTFGLANKNSTVAQKDFFKYLEHRLKSADLREPQIPAVFVSRTPKSKPARSEAKRARQNKHQKRVTK